MADNTLLIRINGDAKKFLDELEKSKKKTKDLEKVLSTTAKFSAAAFAGFSAVIAGITKEFADYEKALVGVGKTTNIEGARLAKFGKEFQKLSSEIPVSTNELLGIAQAAGQLGVTGEQNLLKFSDTIAKLGVATDLTGEQAATSLTRILNVTGESISEIDKFGSVIVALGNNFAATESEIVRVATEVSRSTAVFGVSSTQAAALATSLRSLGVQAQLGGSAVGRAFRQIDQTIRDGGEGLRNLSALTGLTGEQLRKTFEEDANQVFQAFIEGLGRVEKEGGSTTQTLAAFGLKGDEINKVLPVLAKNSGEFARALNLASKEAENATALNNEAAKAFDTLAAEGQRARNNLTNLATNIGEQLAPSILDLLKGVNEVVKGISELDAETLSTIASFLKWGAIITGAVASTATLALGVIKLSALLTSLGTVLFTAGGTAAAFWAALTGPIGIAVAGLAAVAAGVTAIVVALDKDEEPKSLDNINKQLERNKKLREEINNLPENQSFGKQERLNKIDEEIKKLEELRQANLRASEDFGTGKGLIRPEVDTGAAIDLGPGAFGIEDQTVPIRPQEEASEAGKKSVEDTKKNQEAKTKVIEKGTQQRIEAARRENEQLKELQAARAEGATAEEEAIIRRKQELDNERLEAEKIKNEEERALALENIQLKQEQELAAIEEFELQKDERAAERREEQAALDEELRQLDVEQQNQFNEEDRERLAQQIDTQKQAEKRASDQRLQAQIRERNQFKQDEIRFGTEIANLKSFFRKEEVQGVKRATSDLAQLQQSRSSTLKGIGKAAARVQAAIKTAEGAISAYASLSGIPIVGPALGAAAAGAIIAFGVEQQQKISAAQTGGFVPPGGAGARDRVPALLEPGELIVPQAIAPNFIQAAGIPDTQANPVGDQTQGGDTPVIEIMLEDRAGEVISLEQREGRTLGLIGDA